MNSHTSFEIKLAAVIVAAMQLWVAYVIWSPASVDVVHMVLAAKGRDDDWALVLVLLAVMTMYGSIRPKRNCRHLGLALSAFVLVGVFGLVLEARQLTLSTGTVLVLAAAALVVFLGDVMLGAVQRTEMTQTCRGGVDHAAAGR